MKAENLAKLDFSIIDLREIRCSKKFYYELQNRCGAEIIGENKVVYKGIPLTIDDSIQVLDECNLVYRKSDKDFYEIIKDNLKTEIEELNKKIIFHRKNGDFGTYKNLINAYRDVLTLYERYSYNCR